MPSLTVSQASAYSESAVFPSVTILRSSLAILLACLSLFMTLFFSFYFFRFHVDTRRKKRSVIAPSSVIHGLLDQTAGVDLFRIG